MFIDIVGGKGPLRSLLEELTKDLGLDNYINFPGFIQNEKLPLYYQAADLFILPTLKLEGFGLVTVEALSCGTPVLGTKIGGTKEILGELDKNLLFKDTSPESITELILRYSTLGQRMSELRARCREFVIRNYSWDLVGSKLEETFWDICEQR